MEIDDKEYEIYEPADTPEPLKGTYERAQDYIKIAEDIARDLHISTCGAMGVISTVIQNIGVPESELEELALKAAVGMTCLHTTMSGYEGDEPLW